MDSSTAGLHSIGEHAEWPRRSTMKIKKSVLTGAVFAAFAATAAVAPTAGAQQAVVLCSGLEATIVGTPERDIIIGTDGDDVIAALQGNDYVFGGGGDDVICGGFGNDSLFGGEGFDVIFGAQGDDTIAGNWNINEFGAPEELLDDTAGMRAFGGAGNDTMIGTNRWDRMQGGIGDDTLLGYDGRDRLRGGAGNDILVGHAGIDDLGAGSGNDTVAADRLDINVRGAGGFDSCPTVSPRATTWFGCEEAYTTSSLSPLLPAQSFPTQLAGGTADTYVTLGTVDGADSIVFIREGATLMMSGADMNFVPEANANNITSFDRLHLQPVTDGQAKAIAEAFLVRSSLTNRWDTVLDDNVAYYDEAIAWGNRWILLNTDV